jgi:hypothetical protein
MFTADLQRARFFGNDENYPETLPAERSMPRQFVHLECTNLLATLRKRS